MNQDQNSVSLDGDEIRSTRGGLAEIGKLMPCSISSILHRQFCRRWNLIGMIINLGSLYVFLPPNSSLYLIFVFTIFMLREVLLVFGYCSDRGRDLHRLRKIANRLFVSFIELAIVVFAEMPLVAKLPGSSVVSNRSLMSKEQNGFEKHWPDGIDFLFHEITWIFVGKATFAILLSWNNCNDGFDSFGDSERLEAELETFADNLSTPGAAPVLIQPQSDHGGIDLSENQGMGAQNYQPHMHQQIMSISESTTSHDVNQKEYERRVSEVPEDDQTIEVRDQIFHDMMGQDTHGYYRMYGRAVPRGIVYNKDSGPSQASSSSTTVEISKEMEQRLSDQIEQRLTTQIEQRLTAEIEKRVTEKLMIEFQWMKDQMILFQCQGSINTNKQIPDASSMQRLFRESVGDDIVRDEVAGDDINDLQQLVSLRQPSPPQLDEHVVLKD